MCQVHRLGPLWKAIHLRPTTSLPLLLKMNSLTTFFYNFEPTPRGGDSRWTSPCFLSRIKHNKVIKRYQGFRCQVLCEVSECQVYRIGPRWKAIHLRPTTSLPLLLKMNSLTTFFFNFEPTPRGGPYGPCGEGIRVHRTLRPVPKRRGGGEERERKERWGDTLFGVAWACFRDAT